MPQPMPDMNDSGLRPHFLSDIQAMIVNRNLRAPSVIVHVYLSICVPESWKISTA